MIEWYSWILPAQANHIFPGRQYNDTSTRARGQADQMPLTRVGIVVTLGVHHSRKERKGGAVAEKKRVTTINKGWGLFAWPFGRLNLIVLGIGLLFIAVGYILLAQGPATNPLSVSVAPIVLLLGYLVFLPASILVRDPKQKKPDAKKGD